ncbi:hypothetical protein [Tahibacter amnicola]|uniref:Uncharacterized protein n=1 Tax=Tahibacter amnicola TaxID=2976241 RepID=A0ABY6BPY8_9GAMM|nr:hypothetical protein [Tahibacter amnicola]UXI69837.1 hypothetical protein N4264_09485 [Tahibacter amnicola]
MDSANLLRFLPELSALLMLAAFVVLFLRTRSPWLLGAIAAEVASFGFRIAFSVFGSEMMQNPIFLSAWQFSSLIWAGCLLGFAITLPPAGKS